MRRPLLVLLVAAGTAPFLPAPLPGAQEPPPPEIRWIAYLRAPEAFSPGALHVLRSDGGDRHVAVAEGVFSMAAGPGGTAFAVLQEGAGPPSRLVRVPAGGGPETLLEQPGTTYLGVVADRDGRVAVLRYVPWRVRPPRFLRGALETLSRAQIPILTPPELPPAPAPLDTVAAAEEETYELLFTNDPERRLAHAEQVNIFVSGVAGSLGVPPDVAVDVRGTTGSFHCGASACFLEWEEGGVTYSIGEFGSPEEAAAFAESLVHIEELVGDFWRIEEVQAPQLVVVSPDGGEDVVESVDGFCECGFQPVAWGSDGQRLLVIQGAELFTTLVEYSGLGGEPDRLAEGDPGELILDAAYGPEGVMLLVSGDGGGPGTLRRLDGDVVLRGVRAFDMQGNLLAYVARDGTVMVRDLASGSERRVGRGAVDVSVAPDVIEQPEPAPPPGPPPEEGFPLSLAGLVGAGVLALLTGAGLLWRTRRR